MRTLISSLLLIAAANAIKIKQDDDSSSESAFADYCAEFGWDITDSDEYDARYEAWSVVDAFIQEANSDPDSLATYGHNKFSAMLADEIDAMMNQHMQPPPPPQGDDSEDEGPMDDSDMGSDSGDESESDSESSTTAAQRGNNKPVSPTNPSGNASGAPTSSGGIDYRDLGVVNPIKDQGQCGSCYSFATNAQLESTWAMWSGDLLSFSEQQYVDCATEDEGSWGCNGGYPTNLYNYYLDSTFTTLESDYPYTAVEGDCNYSDSGSTGLFYTEPNGIVHNDWTADDIKTALNEIGVLSIGVYASCHPFMYYKSGIMDTTSCQKSKYSTNHAVAMIGWGTEDGTDYWIIRNSWGTGWGADGYIYIATQEDGVGAALCQSQLNTVQMFTPDDEDTLYPTTQKVGSSTPSKSRRGRN